MSRTCGNKTSIEMLRYFFYAIPWHKICRGNNSLYKWIHVSNAFGSSSITRKFFGRIPPMIFPYFISAGILLAQTSFSKSKMKSFYNTSKPDSWSRHIRERSHLLHSNALNENAFNVNLSFLFFNCKDREVRIKKGRNIERREK